MYPGVGVMGSILALLLVWNGIISYFFWREKSFLKKLFPERENLEVEGSVLIRKQFDSILAAIEDSKVREESLKRTIREFQLEGLSHLQKLEVSRYNPYGDTGGSMSFSVVILDGKDNGFVLTSLHTRSGTRIYTKEIADGKCALSLSKEEAEVVSKAIKK